MKKQNVNKFFLALSTFLKKYSLKKIFNTSKKNTQRTPTQIKKNKKIKGAFKVIIFYAIVPSLLINYSLWGITQGKIPFTWYWISSWGIALYLIKHEFLNFWNHLWFKIPLEPNN